MVILNHTISLKENDAMRSCDRCKRNSAINNQVHQCRFLGFDNVVVKDLCRDCEGELAKMMRGAPDAGPGKQAEGQPYPIKPKISESERFVKEHFKFP